MLKLPAPAPKFSASLTTMDLDNLLQPVINFYHSNTVLALVILGVVVLLLCYKPKQVGKFSLVVAAVGLVFYLLSYLGDSMFTGVDNSTAITGRSKGAIEEQQ